MYFATVCLTDVDSEFQQFAVHPRRAPTRVRLRHRANQRSEVGRHGRAPDAAPALPGPPQSEAPSVPGDDGNCDRLVSIKSKYDPGNLFRMNNNIRPSVEGA
jgi:hypothetical protein